MTSEIEAAAPKLPPPGFGQMPPLDEALLAVQQRAERAGFLHGLGVAAGVCRKHAGRLEAEQARWYDDRIRVLEVTVEQLTIEIEACDGREGADVREHCAQFAWSGEGEA